MTNIKKIYFVAIFYVLNYFCLAQAADITEIGPSARAISLGRTFSAIENSVDCAILNPAGLNSIDSIRFGSMFSNLSNDYTYKSFLFAVPIKYGVFGFALLDEQSGEIYKTTLDDNERVIRDNSDPFTFHNQVFGFSIANNINQKTSVGARLKLINKNASLTTNAFGSGTSIDLGLIYNKDSKTNFGLYIENLLNTGVKWQTGTTDPLATKIRTGFSYKISQNLLVAMDGIFTSNLPFNLKAGAEWMPTNTIFLRCGIEQEFIGSENYYNYSLGIANKFENIYINYAYKMNSALLESSSHFVSIGIDLQPAKKTILTTEAIPSGPSSEAKVEIKQSPTSEAKDLTKEIFEKEKRKVQEKVKLLDSKIEEAKKRKRNELLKNLQLEKLKTLKDWENFKLYFKNPLTD